MHPSHSTQSQRAPQPQRAAAAPSCRVGDLLQATDPLRNGPDCLDPRDVERFLAGQLNGRRAERVKAHLLSCPGCRRYAQSLHAALQTPAPPPPPAPARRPQLTFGHVFGLTLAGVLLLLANTAVLDLVANYQTAPVAAQRSIAAPATETVPAAPVTVQPAAEPPAADLPAAHPAAPATGTPASLPAGRRL